MTRTRIAVIGAGLGGITAAIMLQRAGFPVQIYEQAPQISRIGAGIQLGQNVLRVLRHLGLSDALYDVGLVPERHLNREWDTGRILFEIPMQEWAQRFGMPNLILHRGDLQAALAAALQPGTVLFNHHLKGMQTRSGAVELRFANGASPVVDLVIGADGIDSRVREILFGAAAPIYTGMVAYRAIFPTARLGGKGLESDTSKWWSDKRLPAKEDRHFLIYHLTRRRDEVYFVTGSPDPNWDEGVSNVPATIEETRTCYEGFHPEVMRVIDACPAASKWPLLVRPPMPAWHVGPVVLLGDACHPMKPHMGQGANMAMEDGVVLARCIEACDGDPAAAFPLYEATRMPRAGRVQAESFVNVWFKYPTDPGWVYGYDPLTAPLGALEETASATPQMESA